jgi:hypothetical protein
MNGNKPAKEIKMRGHKLIIGVKWQGALKPKVVKMNCSKTRPCSTPH